MPLRAAGRLLARLTRRRAASSALTPGVLGALHPQACHDLIYEGGFTNVVHVGGGIGSWKVDGFPMEYPGQE